MIAINPGTSLEALLALPYPSEMLACAWSCFTMPHHFGFFLGPNAATCCPHSHRKTTEDCVLCDVRVLVLLSGEGWPSVHDVRFYCAVFAMGTREQSQHLGVTMHDTVQFLCACRLTLRSIDDHLLGGCRESQAMSLKWPSQRIFCNMLPVVPHKAVAEVSK